MRYCRFNEKCITSPQMNLIFRARLLWRNLATWIRAYYINSYTGLETEPINERLNNVILEYGNVLRVFFGEKITDDYINLLKSYVGTLQLIFTELMNGNTSAVEEYKKQLYQNIDKRSAFLAQINPFWQENELKSLLYNYADLTIKEAEAIAANNHRREVETFDRLLSHTSTIGDYFSEGLFNYLNYSAR